MATPATAWMKARGMAVKGEFVTPWGICDLVGVAFNPRRVAHRLRLKQTGAIGSITRAALLLRIPDITTKRSTTLAELVRQYSPTISEETVCRETARLIADHFVVASPRGGLRKVNGWMPIHDRLVAVELKMSRIEEALLQAANNLGFADESFVGFPAALAHRVSSNASRWSTFFDTGVGLLSVDESCCRVLIPARKTADWIEKATQMYCVEKFWRTRFKDN